jgi:hypothetical protein
MWPKTSATPSWASAKPKNVEDNRGFHDPQQQITNEFQDEFDAVPMLSREDIATRLVCNRENMNYIKSALAMPHVGIQDFYLDMARRPWTTVKPSAKPGIAPAFLKMGQAIGMRRDMGETQAEDKSRPRFVSPSGARGMADDWASILTLDRVNAYVFRGDKRHPRAIKLANGFNPPSTRKDNAYTAVIARKFVNYMKTRYGKDVNQADVEQYIRGKGPAGNTFSDYEMWRSILKGEEMHIGRMTVDEFLKGYISTSRSVSVAAGFASAGSADGRKDTIVGVYALHSEGGFLLPDAGQHSHAHRAEAEIAHPGALPWNKVVGFRYSMAGNFADPRTWKRQSDVVFMRNDFRLKDPAGAFEVLRHLSSVL